MLLKEPPISLACTPVSCQGTGEQPTRNQHLCMAKEGRDFIASGALHIHEAEIGALHRALLLVFPLLFW